FEGHHELDDVERVGAQIIDEVGLGLDLVLVDAQLLHDDVLDLVFDGSHPCDPPSSIAREGASPPPAEIHIAMPPFKSSVMPVVYDAASLKRNDTAPATS